ncbi:MAG: acyl-CoA desaturase [Planctomycetes bacterium]|nr:acyl-CoA desaturase [Planctomycetota bacterium]
MAQRLDWTNLVFLALGHALAAAALLWLALVQASPWTIGLGFLWFALCGVSITGGYHRLFAHPTYKAHPVLRLFYLVFGAAAVQNSALKWSADHRVHHAKTDKDEDPYNITRGFWWAHIGWVLYRDPREIDTRSVKDLSSDPLIVWQDKHYVALAVLFSGLVPLGLGFLWGDPIGALLVVGFLRLVALWHATFAINSFAHWIGTQPYSTANSARDSVVTALISMGEGYHNFHHRFQTDYRNGVRWYHFDPTKWFVWTMEKVGVTSDLRRVSPEAIARARAQVLAGSESAG